MAAFYIPGLIFLGLTAGALVNSLADMLPLSRGLARSKCLHCGEPAPGWKNYLIPGRCPHCGEPHPHRLRWLVIYLTTVVATLWLGITPLEELGFLLSFILLIYFLLIIVIDIEHRLILIPTVLAGVVLGGLAGTRLHGLVPSLAGGVAGYLIMLLLYKLGEVFIQVMSRLQGEPIDDVALGYGDVNLAGVLGLVLGWPVILIGLVLAILAGGVIGLLYLLLNALLRRYRRFDAMPYAPFLVLSTAFLVFFPIQARTLLANLFPLLGGIN